MTGNAAITLAQMKALAADYERKALEAGNSEQAHNYTKIKECILELVSLHERLYDDLGAADL